MRAEGPTGLMASRISRRERTMCTEFEWVDFALQAPNAMAESLVAAGIECGVPCHGRDHDEPPRG
ncbi:hypothetical protein GCM10027564_07620 [Luteimonas notoginsengisoli]